MSRLQLPPWLAALVVVVATTIVFRYLSAIESGVGHEVALRTYLFWGLVSVPVAALADILVRTISNYRLVRLAVARVKQRR